MACAEVAELEAGDVLVYPSMWWHQVEALEDFNVLVNFWWNLVPDFVDDPMNTLLHGMLTLRNRPEHERKAWKALFDFYIFDDPGAAREQLFDHNLGPLGALDEATARRLRSKLLKKLNR
jgi:ribosomal protein L16 Arg81 hydroxylase